MKIYVLTAGIYSEHRIVGAFDTFEKAKAISEILDAGNVEEHELNRLVKPKNLSIFRVEMKKDGTVIAVKNWSCDDDLSTYYAIYPRYPAEELHLFSVQWAKDEEHAVKITNERRIMLLANNNWNTDTHERVKNENLATN